MKIPLRPLLFATLFHAAATALQAQIVTLVPWNQTWRYLHPLNGKPSDFGALGPNTSPTPWFEQEIEFLSAYTGASFTTSTAQYAAGSGPAPLGYGTLDRFSSGPPLTGFGTTLPVPVSGQRYTSYFRTTFTVPNDGYYYVHPVLQFLMDDGGIIYLDGQRLVRVNHHWAPDAYHDLTLSTGNEQTIWPVVLSDAPQRESVAQRYRSVDYLEPGLHTLAVSVHNQAPDSSDLGMALSITATRANCYLAAEAGEVVRLDKGTPANLLDDEMNCELFVTIGGGSAAGFWTVTSPPALSGRVGSYGSMQTLTGVPAQSFDDGLLTLTIADGTNPACSTTVHLLAPRLLGWRNNGGPLLTDGPDPMNGWRYSDLTPIVSTLTGHDGGAPRELRSQPFNLTGIGVAEISGRLRIEAAGTGTGPEDMLSAKLVLDGDYGNPVNLLAEFDNDPPDGVLTGREITSGTSIATRAFRYFIPSEVNSVQLIVSGAIDSFSEACYLENLLLDTTPAIRATVVSASPLLTGGTVSPADDYVVYSVAIQPVNIGTSTGWTSNAPQNPSGTYAASQPAAFQFSPGQLPRTVTISDAVNPALQATINIPGVSQRIDVSLDSGPFRIENGPGPADDSLYFAVMIMNSNTGPQWVNDSGWVSPGGDYGSVLQYFIPAPLPANSLPITFHDASYPAVTTTFNVPVPPRYVVGIKDFDGPEIYTSVYQPPSPQYVHDPGQRTLTLTNALSQPQMVETDVVDLSAVGAVLCTATISVQDSSGSTNFEREDKVRAELIYETGGARSPFI